MEQRVVITGMGLMTPLGEDLSTFWDKLVHGVSGVQTIRAFDTEGYATKIAASIHDFQPENYIERKEIKRMDRYVQFAAAASKKALECANLDVKSLSNPERVGVIIGSGIGGLSTWEAQHRILIEKGPKRISPFFIPMMIANMASGHVSILCGAKGPNTAAVSACASGAHAIGDSFKIIQRGAADVMICGGAEATISPMGVAGFCSLRAMSLRNDEPQKASRPFDLHRDGFVMGEGSGVVILESLDHAVKRNARIYGEIIGYGMSGDAHHMTEPNPEGAAYCMTQAMKDAKIQPEEVDYINAHGTSTSIGDISETKAIKLAFKDAAKKVAVSSTKSVTGHLLGAAGGVETIVCALTLEHDQIAPTINLETPDPACDLDYVPNVARKCEVNVALSNSFGFGGHNATIILKKFED